MSADPAANLQIFSPPGSGRSSPVPRTARKTAEERMLRLVSVFQKQELTAFPPALYKKDKGFRRYAAGVERALALWDTAQQEWADYISFLGRLLKVIAPLGPPAGSMLILRCA